MLNWRWLYWLVNFLKFKLLLVTLSSALPAWKWRSVPGVSKRGTGENWQWRCWGWGWWRGLAELGNWLVQLVWNRHSRWICWQNTREGFSSSSVHGRTTHYERSVIREFKQACLSGADQAEVRPFPYRFAMTCQSKFVLLSVFGLIDTPCLKNLAEPLLKNTKTSLAVDVRSLFALVHYSETKPFEF